MAPLDFFEMPDDLKADAPPELATLAGAVLQPLSDPTFADMHRAHEGRDPSIEDFMAVVTQVMAAADPTVPVGIHAMAAESLAMLVERSGIVEVAPCNGADCNGFHPVTLTFKGEMFLAHCREAKDKG